jgi:hypothetical protein
VPRSRKRHLEEVNTGGGVLERSRHVICLADDRIRFKLF